MGTLVFDARVGLYDDPPSERAMRFIEAVHEVFKCLHIFFFGIVEKSLCSYVDTPSVKRLSRALGTIEEITRWFVDMKVKELEEMAKKGTDHSHESEGKIMPDFC